MLYALLFALQCLAGCTAAPSERDSVVLIVVDTLRADRLGIYGSPRPTSPNIDAFAAGATVYERASSTAPLTMPAVASLMTGRYPDRAGVTNNGRDYPLATDQPTLAELARDAGYGTAAVVANAWLASPVTRFDRGFATFVTRREVRKRGGRLTAGEVTDRAIAILEGARAPLLLWVHYMDPHMPYRPPAAYARLLGNDTASSAVVRDFARPGSDKQTIYFDVPYPPAEIEATRRLYDGAVRYVDAEIGRLLAAVERSLDRERTLVVLVADHGESLGEHGLWFAHDFTLYQELLHVPLIIRDPTAAASRKTELVSLVDLLPWLCRRIDLACPRDLDGIDLGDEAALAGRQLYAAGPPDRQRYDRNPFQFVSGPAGRWTMIRRGDDKLVRVPHRDGPQWSLFDLGNDPGEREPVDPAGPLAGDLTAALQEWMSMQGSAGESRAANAINGHRRTLDRATLRELRSLGYLD